MRKVIVCLVLSLVVGLFFASVVSAGPIQKPVGAEAYSCVVSQSVVENSNDAPVVIMGPIQRPV